MKYPASSNGGGGGGGSGGATVGGTIPQLVEMRSVKKPPRTTSPVIINSHSHLARVSSPVPGKHQKLVHRSNSQLNNQHQHHPDYTFAQPYYPYFYYYYNNPFNGGGKGGPRLSATSVDNIHHSSGGGGLSPTVKKPRHISQFMVKHDSSTLPPGASASSSSATVPTQSNMTPNGISSDAARAKRRQRKGSFSNNNVPDSLDMAEKAQLQATTHHHHNLSHQVPLNDANHLNPNSSLSPSPIGAKSSSSTQQLNSDYPTMILTTISDNNKLTKDNLAQSNSFSSGRSKSSGGRSVVPPVVSSLCSRMLVFFTVLLLLGVAFGAGFMVCKKLFIPACDSTLSSSSSSSSSSASSLSQPTSSLSSASLFKSAVRPHQILPLSNSSLGRNSSDTTDFPQNSATTTTISPLIKENSAKTLSSSTAPNSTSSPESDHSPRAGRFNNVTEDSQQPQLTTTQNPNSAHNPNSSQNPNSSPNPNSNSNNIPENQTNPSMSPSVEFNPESPNVATVAPPPPSTMNTQSPFPFDLDPDLANIPGFDDMNNFNTDPIPVEDDFLGPPPETAIPMNSNEVSSTVEPFTPVIVTEELITTTEVVPEILLRNNNDNNSSSNSQENQSSIINAVSELPTTIDVVFPSTTQVPNETLTKLLSNNRVNSTTTDNLPTSSITSETNNKSKTDNDDAMIEPISTTNLTNTASNESISSGVDDFESFLLTTIEPTTTTESENIQQQQSSFTVNQTQPAIIVDLIESVQITTTASTTPTTLSDDNNATTIASTLDNDNPSTTIFPNPVGSNGSNETTIDNSNLESLTPILSNGSITEPLNQPKTLNQTSNQTTNQTQILDIQQNVNQTQNATQQNPNSNREGKDLSHDLESNTISEFESHNSTSSSTLLNSTEFIKTNNEPQNSISNSENSLDLKDPTSESSATGPTNGSNEIPQNSTSASVPIATNSTTELDPIAMDSSVLSNKTIELTNSSDPILELVNRTGNERSNWSNGTELDPLDLNRNQTDLISVTNSSLPENQTSGKLIILPSIMPSIIDGITASVEAFCLDSQFLCPHRNGSSVEGSTTPATAIGTKSYLGQPIVCLDQDQICDGIVHCLEDSFDELNCTANKCGQNFMCGSTNLRSSGLNISSSLDLQSQASSNLNVTMSLNETTTLASQPQQSLTQCIPRRLYCDGVWDCPDGSDEIDCQITKCRPNEIRCRDGSACITGKQACDGVYNCRDHSDEIGCISKSSCETSGRFYCDNGLCIEKSLVCDGRNDCPAGSDEQNCLSPEGCANLGDTFYCGSGQCVNASRRCDGHVDCLDYSDEDRCYENDKEGIVHMFNPVSKMWSLYCVEMEKSEFDQSNADELCAKLGHDRALDHTLIEISRLSGGSTWAHAQQSALNTSALITHSLNITHTNSCTSNLTVSVICTTFDCTPDDPVLPLPVNGSNDTAVLVETPEEIPEPLYITAMNGSSKGVSCTAYSIASKWLITSGQCMRNFQSTLIKDIQVTNSNRTWHSPIEQIRVHPKYSIFRSIRFPDYDMALVETTHVLNSSILNSSSICLPTTKLDPEITCFIGSYGSGSGTDTAFEVLESAYCNSSRQFDGAMTPRSLCAARTGLSSTDKPAPCLPAHLPLLCLTSRSEWYLSGFISYQRGCHSSNDHPELPSFLGYYKHPTVFSNLFAMKDFIEQTIGSGTYQIDRPKVALLSSPGTTTTSNETIITTTPIVPVEGQEVSVPETTSIPANPNANHRAHFIRKSDDVAEQIKTNQQARENKSLNVSKLEENDDTMQKNSSTTNAMDSTVSVTKLELDQQNFSISNQTENPTTTPIVPLVVNETLPEVNLNSTQNSTLSEQILTTTLAPKLSDPEPVTLMNVSSKDEETIIEGSGGFVPEDDAPEEMIPEPTILEPTTTTTDTPAVVQTKPMMNDTIDSINLATTTIAPSIINGSAINNNSTICDNNEECEAKPELTTQLSSVVLINETLSSEASNTTELINVPSNNSKIVLPNSNNETTISL